MTTWNDFKNDIQSVSKEEMTILDGLAFLHAERIKREIPQVEFAKKIGMSQLQLAKIESLGSMPSLKALSRYAKGLGYKMKIEFEPIKD